ncbi:uncharacterized protein LOC143637181 [Bidens hawaiensis]|uniref:uncharacterized protein LOC143637181 n=1 Tax=Bidens hawaiensis TaxID=980011 RepID=UPI00404ACCCD
MAIRSISTRTTPLRSVFTTNPLGLGLLISSPTCNNTSARFIQSLTDTRFPKRRPLFNNNNNLSRRKRATFNPPGPYAWVKHLPGDEPIPATQPNAGSLKRRNEKKRIKLRKAFILAEKKQRKSELQEAKKKKEMKRIERKMAAVARDRAWAERLAELQQIEQDKNKAAAEAMA